MISAPDRRRLLKLAAVTLLGGLLAACGPNEVKVQGNFPSPLMEKLPLRVGVWYDEAFANHEFFDETTSREDSKWIVRTGEAQVHMWDTLFGGMFEEMVHMKGEPGPSQMNQVVDAVLIPHVDELQYAIPAHTNVKVYEIWMRYRFQMVTTGGDHIADWTMTAYGKTPTAFLQSDEAAVNLAAVMALRDAGANFATNFTRVPDVNNWLQERAASGPAQESAAGEDPTAPQDSAPAVEAAPEPAAPAQDAGEETP